MGLIKEWETWGYWYGVGREDGGGSKQYWEEVDWMILERKGWDGLQETGGGWEWT